MTDSLTDTLDKARDIVRELTAKIQTAERERDRELARRLAAGEDVAIHGAMGSEDIAELRQAKLAKLAADEALTAAVVAARAKGHSWSLIGAELEMSGEGARQRYGKHTDT